jgi:hypothetical protein
MAPGKELHFFDRNFHKGLEWYQSLFAGADREIQLGEATPNYVNEPAAIRRLADTLPSARLLLSLRDPVERAYSHYWHNRSRGKEPLSWDEALKAEPGRVAIDEINRAWFSYAARGDYMDQIEEVLRYFPVEALHVEIAEEMQANPRDALGRIFKFLQVDDDFVPEQTDNKVNAYVEFRSLRVRDATKGLPKLWAAPINRLNARTRREYPKMAAATRSRLEARYAEGNQRLAEFLDRKSEIWPRGTN